MDSIFLSGGGEHPGAGSGSGKTYQFNIDDKLNSLLLKALLQLGMVHENEPVVFDYDTCSSRPRITARPTPTKMPTAFAERGCRLVVQRTLVPDKQSTLFDCYVYRCILTNDWERDEREVVGIYNQRGASERTFDMQNNAFRRPRNRA